MKRTFEMGGKSYNTLTAIAVELGVKRVYTRDFAKYGITETTVADAASKSVNIAPDAAAPTTATTDNAADVPAQDDDAEDNGSDADNTPNDDQNDSADVVADDQDTKVVDNPLNTGGSAIIFAHATADGIAVDKVLDINPQPQTADDVQMDKPEQSDNAVTGEDAVEVKDDAVVEDTTPAADDAVQDDTADAPAQVPPVAQPQTEVEKITQIEKDVVDYADADELGKAVRKISLQGLIKMVENIQGDTWEHISNEGIRKMRLIMELKKGYFPTAQTTKSTTSSGPSPWKKIPTADLKAAATAKGQTWKECSNEGILRMRLIMVLKAAGVTADELKK